MQNDLEKTLRAIKAGQLEEWLHDFLLGEGRNQPLSEGLKKQKRYWIAPFEMELSKLKRIGGWEKGMEYVDTKESWEKHIDKMMDSLSKGWKPYPLIVEFKNGIFTVRDGSHRMDALHKSGYKKCWTVIWSNNKKDYLLAKKILKIDNGK